MTIQETLKRSSFFSHLDNNALERLSHLVSIKNFEKGNIIFYEGEKADNLLLLADGVVRIVKMGKAGRSVVLHQIEAVSLLAEAVVFEEMTYPASCEAMTSGKIFSINFKSFDHDFLSDNRIAKQIIRSLSSKLRVISRVLENELSLDAEKKLARFILENSETAYNFRHTELAEVLNIKPETLSRTLAKLREKGGLSSTSPIEVKDFNILQRIYEE